MLVGLHGAGETDSCDNHEFSRCLERSFRAVACGEGRQNPVVIILITGFRQQALLLAQQRGNAEMGSRVFDTKIW